jgi:Domain of unknown function (DUF4397)
MHLSWKMAVVSVISCAVLASIGCGSGSAHVRLANVLPSQSDLTLLIDGNTLATSVTYGSASGYISVGSGSHHLQIEASGTTTILIDQTISLSSGDNTVLATNSGAVVLSDSSSTPSSGDISIRAINASSTLGTADVYIVSPSTDISTVNPTASSVAFTGATPYQTVAAGSYVVIFTQPGTKVPVVSSSPLSFTAGQVRSVLALDGQSGGFTTAVLADLN